MSPEIPEAESITVEFKSDRKRLPDSELAAAVICLANTDGGEIFVGVEDDGTITGLHRTHQNVAGLSPMIANRTVPPFNSSENKLRMEGEKRGVHYRIP